MKQPFPFSAIVGQEAMKQAMILTAVDPAIGGVLVFGDRGTGKSTAVRALAALLPEIEAVEGCPVNSATPAHVPDWAQGATDRIISKPTPVVDLPLGVTEDRVVGALDIERALTRGEKAFEPGLLARAALHRLAADWPAACRDLAEAHRIATRGGMRLFLADHHLESARLLLATGDRDAARAAYTAARAEVEAIGYHRRDPELAALADALAAT
jgi:hypothetical protein